MAHIFVAIFLIVFGLNMLLQLSLPLWVMGILALIAGILCWSSASPAIGCLPPARSGRRPPGARARDIELEEV